MHKHYGRNNLVIDGLKILLHSRQGRILAAVIPDLKWPGMYRVHPPDGTITDMANLSRANDAAAKFNESLDRELCGRQKPSEAPYSDLNPGKAAWEVVGGRRVFFGHYSAGQKLIPGPGGGYMTRNQIAASQIAIPTTKTIAAKTRSRVLKCS